MNRRAILTSSFYVFRNCMQNSLQVKTVVNYIHSRNKITGSFLDRNGDGLLFGTELL